jgi:aryl-alcohol dehydrogenase-like predicted oxidoreductase
MSTHSRRDFIKSTLSGAGLLMAAPAWRGLAAEPTARTPCNGNDLVSLGRTGIKVSRLAQGTGYNGWARQSDHTRMGKEAFDRLARHSLERGIRFFDMADLYGTHPFVRDVIKGLPRDQVVLLSKIWVRKEDWVTPSGGAVEEVNRFCNELGTDHLDICLMHCMTDDKWATQYEHVRDDLTTLKQKGRVRAVGVSCHDLGALQLAATHPWVDVIFARINYKGGKDYSMDGTAQEIADVLRLARKSGKAVVGMKIFGAGKLTQPEQKDTSLKFVFMHELVDAITIGMKTPTEVDDTLTRMGQVQV